MSLKILHAPLPLAPKQALPLHQNAAYKKAHQAAEQFDVLMAQQMIQSMESSLDEGNLFGGGVAGDIYNGLAESQLSQTLAKNAHFGLGDQILKQLPKAEVQE